jgi:spore maturation protein CgeB
LCALGHHNEGFVPPEGCAAFYRGAKIVINIHRDSLWSHFGEHNHSRIKATHLNPRFWEAAACGAFQLVSWRADLECYAPEAASFRSPHELATLVGTYLDHQDARTACVTAVHDRLASHHYEARASAILRLARPT